MATVNMSCLAVLALQARQAARAAGDHPLQHNLRSQAAELLAKYGLAPVRKIKKKNKEAAGKPERKLCFSARWQLRMVAHACLGALHHVGVTAGKRRKLSVLKWGTVAA